MFKILMPVDFSPCSLNALSYASQMVKALDGDLTLMHVIEPIGGDATMFIDGSMIEEEVNLAQGKLDVLKHDVKEIQGVGIQTLVTTGFPVEKIIEVAEEQNISLIVMGTDGTNNPVQDILGSNTYNVVKKANCAVLTVPVQALRFELKKILLAVALQNKENIHMLTILKKIARYFQAEIIFFHVRKEGSSKSEELDPESMEWLLQQFTDLKTALITFPAEDIAEAITNYAMANDIDLLAISPQHHNLFSLLFKGSTTRKLVLHAHVPVLTLRADY